MKQKELDKISEIIAAQKLLPSEIRDKGYELVEVTSHVSAEPNMWPPFKPRHMPKPKARGHVFVDMGTRGGHEAMTQVWLCLPEDVAVKVLVLGHLPNLYD
jgi:chemotaxis response regulator CheB